MPPAAQAESLQVVVALATFRRPELVRTLLPQLEAQARAIAHACRVVVVDNDPEESARPVVGDLAGELVTYLAEPRPGIAAARNRALDAAQGADVVVFLDDDEEPGADWLATLVDAWVGWRCAGVAGPVVSRFEGPVDPWVAASGMFQRPRRPTGATVPGAATNNLLLDLRLLERLGLRFDDRFGLTGGSDTMLTRSLIRRGGTIRWCDEAEMHETTPADRATREWTLRRATRGGNVRTRVLLSLAESRRERVRTRADLALSGVKLLVRGALECAHSLVGGGVAARAPGEVNIAKGVGLLRGLRGAVVTEYARAG